MTFAKKFSRNENLGGDCQTAQDRIGKSWRYLWKQILVVSYKCDDSNPKESLTWPLRSRAVQQRFRFLPGRDWGRQEKNLSLKVSAGWNYASLLAVVTSAPFLCLPSLKRPAAWRCRCVRVITHDLDKSRLPNRACKTKITNEESISQVLGGTCEW